jgi:type IV pilus assembly protein PilQ
VQAERWTGERLTFDFKDIDIRDFFLFIANFTGMNVILDPAVKGSLTMKLEDVPWDQALDLVCRTYGYGYEITGNVVNVGHK